MLPKRLIEALDKTRLRNFLALFFLALAIPTAVLIWQAYSQLKWAAFHQYQADATELTQRIDTRLDELIRTADARSFADYTFLVVSGDPSAKFVQRSPLSAYPVQADVPGVIGYFQVDSEGHFSTPLLPPEDTEAASVGISDDEYRERLNLARELHIVLADNRLAPPEVMVGGRRGSVLSDDAMSIMEEEKAADRAGARLAAPAAIDDADRPAAEALSYSGETYSQHVFDELNQPRRNAGLKSVVDGKGDAELSIKDAAREAVEMPRQRRAVENSETDVLLRKKRTEQSALPEPVAVAADKQELANVAGLTDLRINTFESEIDPFEFSLLDSGHLVLFRKVWRDGERYIQGFLLDKETFVASVIGSNFMATALAGMASLDVVHRGNVIDTFSRLDSSRYPNVAEGLDGTLLYRTRLTAPLDSLELIFSIKRLPPGAGASVLGWVTLVLAMVFAGGFITIYRSGLSQIALARQQQDFVSAVSHELKSPLTSIRMYGEMLKEGWADEKKRQSYYEFIHDESERLSRLISNVLQLANITRNEPHFDLKPTNVAELMRNTESKIASQIERAGFELKFNTADDAGSATINIDADCFAQMIINLVDNAIKFSRNADNKTIEISSRCSGDNRILFSVRDYGPGIAKDQMKKIFRLFYRSESELTRETVGTGIGLAIVHQLAVAMAGNVDMVNAEPGAEFRFWFPIA
ncbi:MAG TPA: HAMP domain-containing sensor histidine kinase [Woeseiaceae bacterium]|nr:HAMP domain-containing sensor histidine kinase [Woeseiaceae bacterium]